MGFIIYICICVCPHVIVASSILEDSEKTLASSIVTSVWLVMLDQLLFFVPGLLEDLRIL